MRRRTQETCYAPPTVLSVIRKSLLKKPFSLECFRAMHEKEKLLHEAIRSGNGDTILTVVLFLQRTLKKKHFNTIMQLHPDAVKHFVNFLLIRCHVSGASEFLT